MQTLESMWYKKNKLPQHVPSIPPKIVNAMNKLILKTPIKSTKSNRGKYNNLSSSNKYLVAKYASENGVTKALRYI